MHLMCKRNKIWVAYLNKRNQNTRLVNSKSTITSSNSSLFCSSSFTSTDKLVLLPFQIIGAFCHCRLVANIRARFLPNNGIAQEIGLGMVGLKPNSFTKPTLRVNLIDFKTFFLFKVQFSKNKIKKIGPCIEPTGRTRSKSTRAKSIQWFR